jgi:hypothetical protein
VELLELLHAEMRIAAAAAPTTSTRDSDANFMGLLYGGGRPDSALALGDERCDLAALLFAGNFQVRLAATLLTRL